MYKLQLGLVEKTEGENCIKTYLLTDKKTSWLIIQMSSNSMEKKHYSVENIVFFVYTPP